MPEDDDSDSANEMEIKSEPSSTTPESGSPVATVGMASQPPAPASPVQPIINPSDEVPMLQLPLNAQSIRLGQISTLGQRSKNSSQPTVNPSPSGNQPTRTSVETGQSTSMPGTQPAVSTPNSTPRRRQETKPRSSRITPKDVLSLLRSALPYKYFIENLSYKKEIFERIAADYEVQFKCHVHPTTVHRHFKIVVLDYRKTEPTPRERMHLLGMHELEQELILQEMSHWIAGWEANPNMTWSDAKSREATAIAAWMDKFESSSDGYEQSEESAVLALRGTRFPGPLFRSDPKLISVDAEAWRMKVLKNRAKYLPPGGVPQWRQPSKPRPSGPTRLGALARDRYRGIESPRTPSHSVTSHSVTQRTLPPHIPPRKDSQPQNAGTKYAEFATPQVPQAPQDDSRNIVWKQITTPQMPDRSMLRETDISTQATPTYPAIYHAPHNPQQPGSLLNTSAQSTPSAPPAALNPPDPVPQHPTNPSNVVVEQMTESLNRIGAAVIAAVKAQVQDSSTVSHPAQTDVSRLQNSVDRLTVQVQSLEAQMRLLTDALLKR